MTHECYIESTLTTAMLQHVAFGTVLFILVNFLCSALPYFGAFTLFLGLGHMRGRFQSLGDRSESWNENQNSNVKHREMTEYRPMESEFR